MGAEEERRGDLGEPAPRSGHPDRSPDPSRDPIREALNLTPYKPKSKVPPALVDWGQDDGPTEEDWQRARTEHHARVAASKPDDITPVTIVGGRRDGDILQVQRSVTIVKFPLAPEGLRHLHWEPDDMSEVWASPTAQVIARRVYEQTLFHGLARRRILLGPDLTADEVQAYEADWGDSLYLL